MELVNNVHYPPMERRLRLGFVGGGHRGLLSGLFMPMARGFPTVGKQVAGALSSNPE